MKFRWLGLVPLLLLPLLGLEPQSIRINQLSPSVYRSAGHSNHAVQVVGDNLQMVWVGRDRFSFPFFAEVDLEELKVTRFMKLTEERGRGKGLRMNPSIGRYQGRTWAAWVEAIRRQRRSNYLLNLLEVRAESGEVTADQTEASEESQSNEAPLGRDSRQIFDLGRILAPVTFHHTDQGFFALTHSQDKELDFELRLFVLGPDRQWAQVRSASAIEGMKPVLVQEGSGLGLYFLRQGGGIFRARSDDGRQWSPPQEVGEALATSVDAVATEDGVAVTWSISGQDAVEVYLSRCRQETCSPPSRIFQRPGRLGRVVLSAEPKTGQLFMLLSYWDHENQSHVIFGFAEAQGYKGVRLSPDAQYVSATLVPFLYNGATSAFAVWDQTPGREASAEMGGMVALAEYDYGESRWEPSVATYLAGSVEMFAAEPRLVEHGDSLWTSFVAYRGAEVNEQGLRQMPRAAPTGDLYLVRVEPDTWEARGAEQAGKEYEPARN